MPRVSPKGKEEREDTVKPVIKQFKLGNSTVTMETGRIARQASGAVLVSIDNAVSVLVTVVAAKQAEAGIAVIAFDADTSKSWLDTAQTAGWDAVAAIDEKIAADLKPCLTE